MPKTASEKNVYRISSIFWVLLVYIVAALIWWFISLEIQNHKMTALKLDLLQKTDLRYTQREAIIRSEQKRASLKYIGEGITFLALTLAGAFYVYRSIRKQIELSQQQQNFMMAITHELKTPIATTRLSLETIQRRKLDEAQQQKLINSALAETSRLNILTNNILLAAQMEEKSFRRHNETLALEQITASVVQEYRQRFPQRNITLHTTHATIEGDELLIQIALSNLIDNALKYSPKESEVAVNLTESAGKIRVEVADQGPGILDKEKANIFRKFYRLGDENTRKSKGTGLGLYLTRKIIEQHNGDISVINNQPHGSIFVIQFSAP
ncbi:MAG: sensor histidine kinase [Chitinophagaceae bacterium]